jgi:hypothetical protein
MAPVIAFVVRGVARDRLAHIYQALAESTSGIHIEVFTDPEAARDWLKDQGGTKPSSRSAPGGGLRHEGKKKGGPAPSPPGWPGSVY